MSGRLDFCLLLDYVVDDSASHSSGQEKRSRKQIAIDHQTVFAFTHQQSTSLSVCVSLVSDESAILRFSLTIICAALTIAC